MITETNIRAELERQEQRFRLYAQTCRRMADDKRAGKTIEGEHEPKDSPESLDARAEVWEGAAAETNNTLASILSRGRYRTPPRAARMRGCKADQVLVDEAIPDVHRPSGKHPDLQRPKPCDHVGSCACVPLENI